MYECVFTVVQYKKLREIRKYPTLKLGKTFKQAAKELVSA